MRGGYYNGGTMENFVTRKRFEQIQLEIKQIREKDLPEVARAKKTAAEEGDLKENAGYHGAKERMDMMMAKLTDLEEYALAPSFIDDLKIDANRVTIGTRVKVRDLKSKEESEYTILGPADADPENNVISYLTPIARGLMRHQVTDVCQLKVPSGIIDVKILEIKKFNA